jgi:hypothetical protein
MPVQLSSQKLIKRIKSIILGPKKTPQCVPPGARVGPPGPLETSLRRRTVRRDNREPGPGPSGYAMTRR